jgi:HNH endonuclease
MFKACVQCGEITTNPKFCSSSCSATYNNTLQPKRKAKPKPINKKPILTEEEKYKLRRAKSNEANARYRSRCKYQTPSDENIKALREFYINCPVGYEVDHIVPISKGGAHSLSNLQYLTKKENRQKSNKLNWG